MKVIDAIEQRRAVKHYDPNHKMSEDEITKLISLTMLSPTSFNIQNWRFVVVTDPDLRMQLREAAWNQAQVTEASIVVLLCADLKAWSKDTPRYWKNAAEAVQNFLVPKIKEFYQDNPVLERDEAMRSCGIAAQTLMLAAKSMDYDSCPMIGFDPTQVANLINLPKDHVVAMMVTVGKALKPAHGRGGQIDLQEALIRDRF